MLPRLLLLAVVLACAGVWQPALAEQSLFTPLSQACHSIVHPYCLSVVVQKYFEKLTAGVINTAWPLASALGQAEHR